MNKRKTKKILSKILKAVPKDMDTSDYSFCCAKEFNYGGKTYKGFPLLYFNMIKKGYIYFMKDVPERLYYDEESDYC